MFQVLDWKVLAWYWELIKKSWSWTESILVSSCKWSIEVILMQTVAMWRAEFWVVWSFWIRNGELLGNQMGPAYMKRDRIHISDMYGFLLLTPVCTTKGLEDVDTGWGPVRIEKRVMKSVMMNFGTEMAKPRLSAHTSIFGEWAVRASAIWSTLELVQKTVKSLT